VITHSDGGKCRRPAGFRDRPSRKAQPSTAEPKVIRWQADPERRAARGPSTGSGAAGSLCWTVGRSHSAMSWPLFWNRTGRRSGRRVRVPGFSGGRYQPTGVSAWRSRPGFVVDIAGEAEVDPVTESAIRLLDQSAYSPPARILGSSRKLCFLWTKSCCGNWRIRAANSSRNAKYSPKIGHIGMGFMIPKPCRPRGELFVITALGPASKTSKRK